MRPSAALVTTILASTVLVPASSRADALDVVPMMGHTVVTAHGNAGIRLQLPRTVRMDRSESRVRVIEGTIAFAGFGIGDPTGPQYWRAGTPHVPGTWLDGQDLPLVDPPIFSGIIDLYILSDGVATVEFDLDGVEGAATYEATGVVQGIAQHLPSSCREPLPCTGFSGGGVSHSVTDGLVIQASYSEDAVAGSHGRQQCAYPEEYGYSAAPADHPDGCDVLGASGSSSPLGSVNTLTLATDELYGGDSMQFHYDASGPWYLGSRAHHLDIAGPSRTGAIGVWASAGITS